MTVRHPLRVLLLALASTPFPGRAQNIETDYSKYARPFIFVPPERPAAVDKTASAPRKYIVEVEIGADGQVKTPVDVAPAEPSMVDAVNTAARLWVFYPQLTSDCKPGPRRGRVGLEYDGTGGKSWLEVAGLEGINEDIPRKARSIAAAMPPYPRKELQLGIEGRVTIAMKVLSDGSTAEHVVYMATPRTQGLATAALQHARRTKVEFDPPIDKPFVCKLTPYQFRIE